MRVLCDLVVIILSLVVDLLVKAFHLGLKCEYCLTAVAFLAAQVGMEALLVIQFQWESEEDQREEVEARQEVQEEEEG